jgi:hypothetical protein
MTLKLITYINFYEIFKTTYNGWMKYYILLLYHFSYWMKYYILLWTLKGILRAFELVLGLKVNFSKSCVLGVNVSEDFIRLASVFLNCKVGVVPFKYLGLPVGANSRRASLGNLCYKLSDNILVVGVINM